MLRVLLFSAWSVSSLKHLLLLPVGRQDKSYTRSVPLWLFLNSKYRTDEHYSKFNKNDLFTCMLVCTLRSLCLPSLVRKGHQLTICLICSFIYLLYSEHASEVDSEQHNSGAKVQLMDWWFDFGFFG